MNKYITASQRCVVLIGGIEIWVESDRADKLQKLMETQKYIELEGSTIAVSQIAGIFTSNHMDELKRKKNGQWICKKGVWHDRGEKCRCDKKRVIIKDGKNTEQEFIIGQGWINI